MLTASIAGFWVQFMGYIVRALFFSAGLVFSAAAGADSAAANVSNETLARDFERMLQWFPGEYDNKLQAQADIAAGLGEGEAHEYIQHIFKPVKAPNIGKHVFFIKQTMDGDYENVYRQRLYTLEQDIQNRSVKLTIYSFLDEKKYRYTDKDSSLVANIRKDELRTVPGCEVYWTYHTDHFIGRMKERACHFYSQRSKKTIYISDTLKLTDREIWIADQAVDEQGNYVFGNKAGIPHKNIKVKSL